MNWVRQLTQSVCMFASMCKVASHHRGVEQPTQCSCIELRVPYGPCVQLWWPGAGALYTCLSVLRLSDCIAFEFGAERYSCKS